MKREFIKLVGGIPSIVPKGPSKQLSKGDKIQAWVWSKFRNPARSDGLILTHWQRKEDVGKDYEYAQLNKKIDIVEFTMEEYDQIIKNIDNSWTLDETLYLWDLCKRFDLRFTTVHDLYDPSKFGKDRTIEELKDRYYSVSRKLLETRGIHDHPIIKSGYNYEQEMKRRAYLERTINRSVEESLQESAMLKQAEEIEKKIEKFEKLEENLKKLSSDSRGGITFEDFIKSNANESDSFVYLRSQKLKHPLPVSEKLQRKVDVLLREMNIPDKLTPTIKVDQAYNTLRNNLVIFTSLKKHLEKKEKELANLMQKSHEVQNKPRVPPPQNNVVNSVPTNVLAAAPDQSMELLSISSTGRERPKKNGSGTKAKKVKYEVN
jgi:DNA methyltransferase 1-associated protein 1